MKRIFTCLPALVLALILALTATPAWAQKLTVVADEWCPYNCEPGSENPGFGIEILQLIFKDQGIEIDYSNMDWDQAIEETREGRHDAIIGAAKEDAPDFVFPKNEFGVISNVFYVLKDNPWRFKDLSSLKGKKIGIIEAYAYSDTLDEYFAEHPKDTFVATGDAPLEILIDKLLKKEIDAVIEDNYVFLLKAREKMLFTKVRNAGGQGTSDPIYIAFSPKGKKSKQYAETVSKGIEKLRASGELGKILEKYGIEDWKK